MNPVNPAQVVARDAFLGRGSPAAVSVPAPHHRPAVPALAAPERVGALRQRRSVIQWGLIAGTVLILGVFLILPLIVVFVEAFRRGWQVYLAAITDAEALSALRLSLTVTTVALVMNLVFGLSAAWCLAKFRFPGRSLLISLIDLPISLSPVVVGLLLVLVYGQHGVLGRLLESTGLRVIFGLPGIVLATAFVTLPLVVREVLPVLEAQGSEEEEAARLLGASGWQIFFRVTLPNIRWALLYGVILCTARALGEFGAVSVVSGHIRGFTITLPLHVEILYNEYQFSAAFAVASLLTGIGLVSLIVKAVWENSAAARIERSLQSRPAGMSEENHHAD